MVKNVSCVLGREFEESIPANWQIEKTGARIPARQLLPFFRNDYFRTKKSDKNTREVVNIAISSAW